MQAQAPASAAHQRYDVLVRAEQTMLRQIKMNTTRELMDMAQHNLMFRIRVEAFMRGTHRLATHDGDRAIMTRVVEYGVTACYLNLYIYQQELWGKAILSANMSLASQVERLTLSLHHGRVPLPNARPSPAGKESEKGAESAREA